MMIPGTYLLLGFVSGLRLTLASFLLMLLATLVEVGVVSREAGLIASIGQMTLASVCVQAGYVAGIVARAYAAALDRPRFSKSASTPGSLPRKAR